MKNYFVEVHQHHSAANGNGAIELLSETQSAKLSDLEGQADDMDDRSQGCHKRVIGCHFGTPGAAGMGLDAVLVTLPLVVMYLYLNPMLPALLYDL